MYIYIYVYILCAQLSVECAFAIIRFPQVSSPTSVLMPIPPATCRSFGRLSLTHTGVRPPSREQSSGRGPRGRVCM